MYIMTTRSKIIFFLILNHDKVMSNLKIKNFGPSYNSLIINELLICMGFASKI